MINQRISHAEAAVKGARFGTLLSQGIRSELGGVSLSGWLVLDHLCRSDGIAPQKEIVGLFQSKANTTEVISNLCIKGLAYRAPNPESLRERYVGITDEGRKTQEETTPRLFTAAATLLNDVSESDVVNLHAVSSQALKREGVKLWTPVNL